MRRAPADPPSSSASQPVWDPVWSVRGVIEVLEPLVDPTRRRAIRRVGAERLRSVTLLMDAPHDPHNAAAVMRSCDAFGVQTLHVVPRTEPFVASRTVAKGTERWVDVVVHETPLAAVTTLREAGFRLIGSHPQGTLTPPDLAEIPRLCLVLGNEHDGIREELSSAVEDNVRVPMRGFVESLNVSVSGAILLHAATTRRTGDLTEDEKLSFYAKGLFRTVSRAAEILGATRPR